MTIATKRSGIIHLQSMKDLEFVSFAQDILSTGGKLDNVPMTLKVDGLGGRFGKSVAGNVFFEGSRTGPIFTPKSFSNFAKSKGHDGIRLTRAEQYDEIWDIVTTSKVAKSLPVDTKVICEIFYNPMGELGDDGIKFVSVKYDPKKLGSILTIVPISIITASTGEPHENEDSILKQLYAMSTDKVRVINPTLKMEHSIDVTAIISPMQAINNTLLTSLKRDDAEDKVVLKAIVQLCKNELAEYILKHPAILGKDILGPNIEGIVVKVNGKDIKITTPEFKASKKVVSEAVNKKTIVMAFGRFQPPTTGHGLLIKKVVDTSKSVGGDHIIFASKSQDKKQNPLPVDRKVVYLKKMFPGVSFVAASAEIRTFMEAAKVLNNKYSDLIMIAGSDRVKAFEAILNQYNGKDFNFDSIRVVSAGERDPDSDSDTGMSGTKMRAAAIENNVSLFTRGMPKTMNNTDIQLLMKEIQVGMGSKTDGIKYKDLLQKIK